MCRTYRRKGFTLIELVIVTGLLAVLLGAATMTFVTGLRVGDIGMTAGGVRKEASYSFRVMSEELRRATAVTSAGLHSVTFQADLDGDGVTDDITYSWSGTAGEGLLRTAGANTAIIASGVEDASFQYYDSSNVAMGPPFPVSASAVRTVGLTLKVSKEGESVQYPLRIRLRGT